MTQSSAVVCQCFFFTSCVLCPIRCLCPVSLDRIRLLLIKPDTKHIKDIFSRYKNKLQVSTKTKTYLHEAWSTDPIPCQGNHQKHKCSFTRLEIYFNLRSKNGNSDSSNSDSSNSDCSNSDRTNSDCSKSDVSDSSDSSNSDGSK